MSDLPVGFESAKETAANTDYGMNMVISARLVLELTDLIEQPQQRIAELEAKTSYCIGVGNGNGRLFIYGDHESIKTAQRYVLERDELAATVERQQTEINALKAHVERFSAAILTPPQNDDDEWCNVNKVALQTPRQNLNAVKREAFIEGFKYGSNHCHLDYEEIESDAEEESFLRYPDKE